MVFIVVLLLTGAAVFMAYRAGWWRMNYVSDAEYPVQGIDVSHHQGVIRWGEISKTRFSFVFIKATEGGDFVDKRFVQNWQAARAEGFEVGAYHFFTLCRPATDQAQNFIKTVPRENDALPPVVDLEYVGNCSKRPDPKVFAAELQVFIETISAHYGQAPILYTTYEFRDDYLSNGQFDHYAYWIRDVWGRPRGEKIPDWYIWQYADNARISGIDGPVDLNVMTIK